MTTTRPARDAPSARAVALALLGGVAHGLCFAPFGVWPVAFVATAPLAIACHGRAPGVAALLGWLAGTVTAALALVPWLSAATRDYFDHGLAGGIAFAAVIGQVYVALPDVAFALGAVRAWRLAGSAARVLTLGALWTAIELARTRTAMGSPWDLLAHALYAHPAWIQLADLGGTYAVSFVLAAAGAAAADVAVHGWRGARAGVATALLLTVTTLAYGTWRLGTADDAAPPVLRLALVQGAVPGVWRDDAAHADDAFAAFADATRPALSERPDLVVWSENALGFLLAPNPRFLGRVAELLGPGGPPLVLGAPRFEQTESGRARFYNAVHLLSADGRTLGTYDKRRLVPFAEYSPLPVVPGLGWRVDAPGEYSPGHAPTIFDTPVPFGVLICFEAIYPDLAADLARAGARVVLNLSNDDWFGNHAGLEQHFAMAVFRAVETRRAIARTTNAGITGVIAPSGRITVRFPAQVRRARVVSVPLRDGTTPYTRTGDVAAWLAVLGAALGLGTAGGQRRWGAFPTGVYPSPAPPPGREP